jgi:hypothetical protein
MSEQAAGTGAQPSETEETAETAAETPAQAGEPVRDDTEVQPFLDRFARALIAADGATIAGMWETPALVVSDQGAKAVASTAEVEAFFSGAAEQYTSRGIVGTRADIVWFDQATDRVAIVQVRWPYLDKGGKEMGEEVSTYTLHKADSGDFKICAVVMHGSAGTH